MKFFFISLGFFTLPLFAENLPLLSENFLKNFEIIQPGISTEEVEKESAVVFTYYLLDQSQHTINFSQKPIYAKVTTLPLAWQKILMGMKSKETKKVFLEDGQCVQITVIYAHVNPHEFPTPCLCSKKNIR